jgi:hypothetical protein
MEAGAVAAAHADGAVVLLQPGRDLAQVVGEHLARSWLKPLRTTTRRTWTSSMPSGILYAGTIQPCVRIRSETSYTVNPATPLPSFASRRNSRAKRGPH